MSDTEKSTLVRQMACDRLEVTPVKVRLGVADGELVVTETTPRRWDWRAMRTDQPKGTP